MEMTDFGNQFCASCHLDQATMFCTCTKVFLCDNCLVPHKNKEIHLIHQISVLRIRPADPGRAELERNLNDIDDCCQELTQAVEQLTAGAQATLITTLQELGKLRSTLAQEIEGGERGEGRLAPWLNPYRPGTLKLFDYRVDTSQIENFLASLLAYRLKEPGSLELPLQPAFSLPQEAPSVPIEPYQASVTEGHVSIFSGFNQRMEPAALQSALRLSEGSRWQALDSEHVFVCGGGNNNIQSDKLPSSPWAWLVFKSGLVQDLPNMSGGHCYPGLLLWKSAMNVFGGYPTNPATETGRLCERFMMNYGKWEMLPALYQMRYCFNPVLWQRAAYICGGFTTSIEVFNGTAFTLLTLQLPEKDSPTIACCRGGDLVILSHSNIVVLSPNLGLERKLRPRSILQSNKTGMPALFGELLVIVSESRVFKYSLITGQEQSVV